jgi:hypothetical protein
MVRIVYTPGLFGLYAAETVIRYLLKKHSHLINFTSRIFNPKKHRLYVLIATNKMIQTVILIWMV